MKRLAILLTTIGVLLTGLVALGQSDLDVFPLGTTRMLYNVTSEDMSEPQTLELTVTVYGDDRYTVRMTTEQTGGEDELATGFGFIFGATRVSSGGGHDVSYNSLEALMDQRSRLQEGQDYLLPGGGAFTEIVGVTIAGVFCLEGTLLDEEDPNVRVKVAFALSHPVYISPRIAAEEMQDGEWVQTFAIELVEYVVEESEG